MMVRAVAVAAFDVGAWTGAAIALRWVHRQYQSQQARDRPQHGETTEFSSTQDD